MREIKFRAWDGEEMRYTFSVQSNGDGVLYSGGIVDWKLMQFTGLKDKNGKEIYEGDIVNIPLFGNCIIIWNESICAFQYAYHAIGKGTSIGGRMTNTLYSYEQQKYEVIGNIYENPELINK